LIRLAVRCVPAAAPRVLAELLEQAPGGVEEEEGPGWVEYAIYGAPGELPDLGSVRALADDEAVEVTSAEVPDDWADRWQDFHEPILVGDRVLIRPSWAQAPTEGVVDVVIDPGQAFGTGAHPTTRMCVELLLELEGGGPLADIGTGSGVLAITAAKLGFGPVVAVDSEVAALEAATANAAANGVTIEAERVNVRERIPPWAETTVANLTAPLLAEVAATLDRDRAPRRLLCSGLLAREADDVSAGFAAAGLAERARRRSGDWVALGFASQ
jgi:ribosomal protein L11 methyltransferase